MGRRYWLDLFSPETWNEFLEAGGEVSGFRESHWKRVRNLNQGDYLLCYMTGVSRFIGLLEVTGEPYKDGEEEIWSSETFPCRVPVRVLIRLEPETAVPVLSLRDDLSVFKNLKNPMRWSGAFRSSLSEWSEEDGQIVVEVLRNAEQNPVVRPISPSKLRRLPKASKTKIGTVTVVPDDEEEETETVQPPATAHTEIQWLLLTLGSDMGLDVWVARNDRGREYRGNRLGELPRVKTTLPTQFDAVTQSIIELIDVLWLQGNAILAAFEIESTTQVYSGLLRMADLVAVQPNLNIPLYIVAPEDRREKVFMEANRPTFSRLKPPLAEICRYISFNDLRSRVSEARSFLHYLKPDFIEELSEPVVLEES